MDKEKYLHLSCKKLNVFDIKLPPHLVRLEANMSNIMEFTSELPSTLEIIHISFNKLLKFDKKLPDNLKLLDISYNNLVLFSSDLPLKLKELHIDSNCLRSFNKNIPNTLEYLNIKCNKFKKLKLNYTPEIIVHDIIKNKKTFRKKWFYLYVKN